MANQYTPAQRLVTEARLPALADELGIGSSGTLTLYSGGTLDIGAPDAGRMVGILAQADGTVAGVDVAQGQTWVFVGDGTQWTGYQAGGSGGGAGGSVLLAQPTVSASSVTDKTVALAYSTTTSGSTAWQYRLNGGAASALDGTSPDTITGLTPSTEYTAEVRFTVDGAEWSAWSAPVAFTTSAPVASALSFKMLTARSEAVISTTTTTDDTLTVTGLTANNNIKVYAVKPGTTTAASIPKGADGYFEFTVPALPTGSGGYGSQLLAGFADTVGGPVGAGFSFNPSSVHRRGGSWAGGVNTGTSLSAGTQFRVSRLSTGTIRVEQRQGETWTSLGEQNDPHTGAVHFTVNPWTNIDLAKIESIKGVTA